MMKDFQIRNSRNLGVPTLVDSNNRSNTGRCLTVHAVWQLKTQDKLVMASSPLVMRIVASSACIAQRAGRVIRDILKQGDLGIVSKVETNWTEASEVLIYSVISVMSVLGCQATVLNVTLYGTPKWTLFLISNIWR